jgi:hypothetical protein
MKNVARELFITRLHPLSARLHPLSASLGRRRCPQGHGEFSGRRSASMAGQWPRGPPDLAR